VRWSDVEVVLALWRGRRLDLAAQRLGVDTATVSRKLRAIEDGMGVPLFDRTRQGLMPTAVLEKLVPHAEEVEAAMGLLLSLAEGFEARAEGTVRLTAAPQIAEQLLAPRLPSLLAKAPDLEVELIADQRVLQLDRREADVAVRLARPEAGDFVIRKLRSWRITVAAAPALVQGRPPLTHWGQLPWIGWDASMSSQPLARFLASQGLVARVRSNSVGTQRAAARAGLGLAAMPRELVSEWGLLEVQLSAALKAELDRVPPVELWLVSHRALRHVPRVQAVWQWLVDELAESPG
jgi:DNA-binding transcriptional LysR family regulator